MAPSDEDFRERPSDYQERRPERGRGRDRDDDDDDRPRRRRRYADEPAGTSGMAIWSLILGLLGFVTCAITGLPGLILGVLALVAIKRGDGRVSGAGLAWTGIILSGISMVVVPFGLYFSTMKVRESAERMQASNNLHETGVAMHSYNDAQGTLPPATLPTKDGKPGLSWRVALLPYLGEDSLYRQFHLDEPWDSPHNITLLEKMPRAYRSPNDPPGTKETPYRVFVGKNAPFDKEPNKRGKMSVQAMPDGTSNTILVVEAAQKVPWTKPDELDYTTDGPLPELGYVNKDMFVVLMADGSIRWLSRKARSESALRNGIDPRDDRGLDF